MFTWSQYLFFQHNQQYDTLLAITPCAHKLKAGIAYCTLHLFILVLGQSLNFLWPFIGLLHALHFGLLLVLSPGFETTTAGTKMCEKQ